ncbi:uncharacterized protein LOC132065224 [Lycium ferocissimum]|uniref:uncharacterized protein LOC132065224 n=1 Tax=Lycium ferocissimum TaxID=112874 RepID=UPI0028149709|nr:uncharacterized protein LOC132065224 [Lycium ferocissimum]
MKTFNDMAGQGQARSTPSGSSRNRARRQYRRVRRRGTHFHGREVIRNNVPRVTQNLLRDQRAIRREGEKKFKEFKAFKMSPNTSVPEHIELFLLKREELANFIEISDWEALAILVDSLREPWSGILVNIYHDFFLSQPFEVYVQELEVEWEIMNL